MKISIQPFLDKSLGLFLGCVPGVLELFLNQYYNRFFVCNLVEEPVKGVDGMS